MTEEIVIEVVNHPTAGPLNKAFLITRDDQGVIINKEFYSAGADVATVTATKAWIKRQELSRDLLREIWDAFEALAISEANKFTLMQTITVPLMAISNGFFGKAKTFANLIPTDTIYTAGRKAALIALIDKYIAMVP